MGKHFGLAVPVVALALTVGGSAMAGFTNLGGGWVAEWDGSLDPFVDIVANGRRGDALFIQKSAQFTQGSQGGIFPAIPIVFRQIAPSTVTHIVIDDEIIGNFTGETWTGFTMQILDHGDASFNPALTLASGGGGPIGFSVDPFDTAFFSNDDTQLNIGGASFGGTGSIGDGELWFPGNGANDGQLWINVNSAMGEPFTLFTLKETPLPGPATLALLALAGLGSRRRRG